MFIARQHLCMFMEVSVHLPRFRVCVCVCVRMGMRVGGLPRRFTSTWVACFVGVLHNLCFYVCGFAVNTENEQLFPFMKWHYILHIYV